MHVTTMKNGNKTFTFLDQALKKWGVEVKLPRTCVYVAKLSISGHLGCRWTAHATNGVLGWAVLRACLEALEHRKMCCAYRKSKSNSPFRSVPSSRTLLSITTVLRQLRLFLLLLLRGIINLCYVECNGRFEI